MSAAVASTIGATYVEPSATTALEPGTKIADLFSRNMQGPVVQRLTDRVWWVAAFNYQTVFYVGDESVLLFDAPEGISGMVAAAIADVTDKPVSTVVYSHYHADHIADIGIFVDAARERGEELTIIGSSKTAEKMRLVGSQYPVPTQVIGWPQDSFQFEGLTVQLHGFEWAAHTDDHSAWLLVQEGVVHSPDLINPDQPPFWRFAGNERFLFSAENLRQVRDLEWTYLSGGHGNVGYREDVDFDLAFMEDLVGAVGTAMGDHDFMSFVDMSASAHTEFLAKWIDAIAADAVEALRPKYGELYGYEAATRPNAEMVAFSMFEHR